jgi:hypothetical protein
MFGTARLNVTLLSAGLMVALPLCALGLCVRWACRASIPPEDEYVEVSHE